MGWTEIAPFGVLVLIILGTHWNLGARIDRVGSRMDTMQESIADLRERVAALETWFAGTQLPAPRTKGE